MLQLGGGATAEKGVPQGTLFQRVDSDCIQNLGPNRISRLSAPQWLSACLFTLLGTVPGRLEPSEAVEFARRDS